MFHTCLCSNPFERVQMVWEGLLQPVIWCRHLPTCLCRVVCLVVALLSDSAIPLVRSCVCACAPRRVASGCLLIGRVRLLDEQRCVVVGVSCGHLRRHCGRCALWHVGCCCRKHTCPFTCARERLVARQGSESCDPHTS